MDIFNINGYNLDETQINAIKSTSKSTLVVAGAGAGKTLTILGKLRYLIEVMHYKESEILCISFTNETVSSLKNKISVYGYNIDVYTFHKLGLSILGNVIIAPNNYLDYIIDEYFKSFLKYDKKRTRWLKNMLFTNKNIDNIYNTYEFIKLKQTISTFIKLLKSNNLDINYIYKKYKYSILNKRKLLLIIMEILTIYTNELSSAGMIDFDDMINKSAALVKSKDLPYKFIIIDEFQDTSLVRYALINEIIKKNNASIFVVGDDWQSIYRFSGCDLNIFVDFKKYFKDTSIYKLKYTYRNSNELIKVSSSFVMKNKMQISKSIISNKNLEKPIKICFNYTVEDIVSMLDDKDILVIGRNNKDIENINFDNKLTIHRSKGLEADNVILVNSDNIPSTIKEEKILNLVLNKKDYILYAEERRLFYVALTRTKNSIYILVNKKISPFVKELIHDYKSNIEILKK